MPKLSCRSCGRQIHTVAPLEALVAEERRCPRCGAFLHEDRRATERRSIHRRTNPPNDPGPPKPKPKRNATLDAKAAAAVKPTPETTPDEAAATDGGEDRVEARRSRQRRGGGTAKPPAGDSSGSRD